MLLMAVVLAGGAAFVANTWLEGQMQTGAESQARMVNVAAAAVEIPYGQKLEMAHIKMVAFPRRSLPAGTYGDPQEIVGKIAAQSVLPGEMILEGRVVEHLGGSTLAAVIEPGMRAVAVRVNEIIGVAGFLLPGNRVDVLSSKGSGARGAAISTILQDIKVLAVDQTASTDKNEPVIVRAVTLEVTPLQAEALVKATSEGKVQLSLRNPQDDKFIVADGEPEPAATTEAKPTHYTPPKVIMIRGTDVSLVKVNR